MSASFIRRFAENENATSIVYNPFVKDQGDSMYPTFSICLQGSRLHWYYPQEIFDAYELSFEQFERMLEGKAAIKYDYDLSLKLFKKVPTFVNNGSDVPFSNFHLKMTDILIRAKFTSLSSSLPRSFIRRGRGEISGTSPFNTTYQTPDMICFTRDSGYVEAVFRFEDSFILDKVLMIGGMYNTTDMSIFVHHPGQLIRSLDVPIFKSSFQKYRYDKLLSFKISQSTVVRGRPGAKKTCTSTKEDYDMYLINTIIEEIKCIPSYWKDYAKTKIDMEVCTSQVALTKAYSYTKTWKAFIENHTRPCIDMYNTVAWNWLDAVETISPEEVQIKLTYQEQYYQELRYLPDFDFETFISNVGGFVGIFLGYSLMQVPELIGNF